MSPDIDVRPCRSDELQAVLDLWTAADATPSPTDSLPEMRRLLQEPQATLFVALHEDQIVGSVIAAWDGWRGNIYRIAVAPWHRRRGIAAALIRSTDESLRQRGAHRITALVEGDHSWAVGFWDSPAAAGYVRDPHMIRFVKDL